MDKEKPTWQFDYNWESESLDPESKQPTHKSSFSDIVKAISGRIIESSQLPDKNSTQNKNINTSKDFSISNLEKNDVEKITSGTNEQLKKDNDQTVIRLNAPKQIGRLLEEREYTQAKPSSRISRMPQITFKAKSTINKSSNSYIQAGFVLGVITLAIFIVARFL